MEVLLEKLIEKGEIKMKTKNSKNPILVCILAAVILGVMGLAAIMLNSQASAQTQAQSAEIQTSLEKEIRKATYVFTDSHSWAARGFMTELEKSRTILTLCRSDGRVLATYYLLSNELNKKEFLTTMGFKLDWHGPPGVVNVWRRVE